ncbi:MAG: hypothetical protein ACTSQI_10805 [Candidatus Helarchaeota archaeon]
MSSGNLPTWLSVIPPNLIGIYVFSWSILSFSNVFLQIFGFYIAARIITNSQPKRGLIQYIFFYCWVSFISGIVLIFQSIFLLSLSASWTSLSVANTFVRFGTWATIGITGITGMLFIWYWLKNQLSLSHIKFCQISLISYACSLLFISFSDFAMKTYFSLLINSIIAGVLVGFAFKLKLFMQLKLRDEKASAFP